MTNACAAINNVQFELSNRCGYSAIHPRCPNDVHAAPCNLPLVLVEGVLAELAEVGFAGEMIFSIYNEALTDPRLFYLLDRLRCMCPAARPYMYTNAWNLDQQLLDELAGFGLTRLFINAYSPSEYERVETLFPAPCLRVDLHATALDSRMDIYDAPAHGRLLPCHAIRRQVVIWSSGEVGLCCVDWRKSVIFGSLHESRLSEILVTPERVAMRDALVRGDRACAGVCSGCKRHWDTE
jgi:hypothetical protein